MSVFLWVMYLNMYMCSLLLCEYVGMHVCAYLIVDMVCMVCMYMNTLIHVHINIHRQAWKSVNVCEYLKLGVHGCAYIHVGTYGILASYTSPLPPPQPHKWSHQTGAFSPSVPFFSCQAHRWHCIYPIHPIQ